MTKMKDGTTHLACKAENVVDVDNDLILVAVTYSADRGDAGTMVDSVIQAQVHLQNTGITARIEEVAMDKEYHSAANLELADSLGLRTYIPEPKQNFPRRWIKRTPECQRVVHNNRWCVKRTKGCNLQRTRSELIKGKFAQIVTQEGFDAVSSMDWKRLENAS